MRLLLPVSCIALLLAACGGQSGSLGSSGNGSSASGGATSSSSGASGSSGGSGSSGSSTGTPPDGGAPVPRLSVSGAQILDPVGNPVLLRGWNWGQWGSVQPQDGADNMAQGANAVRIPLRWWGLWADTSVDARSDAAPGHVDPAHLAVLDGMIREATDWALWVVLFVDSNCGQASLANDTVALCGTATDGAAANFLNDPATSQKFTEVWAFLAARYATTPYIGMYEILPEPNFTCSATRCTDWSTAPTFYASIIPTIRAADPRTPILVGPDSGYDIRKIETAYIPGVAGLVYTGDLLSFGASNPSFVTAATDFRTKHDVPVFIQQVGVKQTEANADATAETILSLLDTDGIGWTWWTYRETKSPNGTGFAPFSQDKGGPWAENAAWLALIDAKFK